MNQRQVTKIDGHFLAIDHLNFAEAALLVLAVHQAETAGNLHAFPRHGDDFEFSTPDTRGAVILNKLSNTDSGHHRIHDSLIVRFPGMEARDRKSTRLNSSHYCASRMPSSA